MISVALIEDNRLVREGLAGLLNQADELDVVALGADWQTGVPPELKPQVVLLIRGSWNGDCWQVAPDIKQKFPGCKIVVMDALRTTEGAANFGDAGVSGFIAKDAALEDLVHIIRSVTKDEKYAVEAPTGARLTPREHEVIDLIAAGFSNNEIAHQLCIAKHTVKSHVRNVMEKLRLHTRLQIAAYVHREQGT